MDAASRGRAGAKNLRRWSRFFLHPARTVVLSFAAAILAGSLLLMLPFATADGRETSALDALFTSTSAVCVTGLIVVDTPTHWTGFGQTVIVLLIQLGGLGIMTLASLVALALSRRVPLGRRLGAQRERSGLEADDVRKVLLGVVGFLALFEGVIAVVLTSRFLVSYDYSLGTAVAHGVFHSVSAVNNAGFALYSDSLMGFVGDWWISLAVMIGVILGGLGFPVLQEMRRLPRTPRRWSIHTKLTLLTTGALLVFGFVAFTAFEWSNSGTLGPLDTAEKLLAGAFQSVMPRTAGFNTVDTGALRDSSLLLTDTLMLVGGGSASTAGGIKVTTFALLGLVIWSELRGETDVTFVRRRFPTAVQREALTIALLAVAAVIAGTLVIVTVEDYGLSASLFETISAFGTVGLSTGITPELPGLAKGVLIAMMFLGRLGPITLGTALVLRRRERRYRYPEERPIVG